MVVIEKGYGSLKSILDLKGNGNALCISMTLHAFASVCDPSPRMQNHIILTPA